MEAVEAADVLIFTTPLYCLRASGPMESFPDLTFNYWMVHGLRECMLQKGGMGSGEAERAYWEEKGWLGAKRPWK